MQNGVAGDGVVQFGVGINGPNIELIVQIFELASHSISYIDGCLPISLSWVFYFLRSWLRLSSC